MFLILIILFTGFLSSSDFYWKRIGSERFLPEVITTIISSQDSIFVCSYRLTLSDPDFFNLDYYEKRGQAISKNNGFDWEILAEQEWNLDYEDFYESSRNKNNSFSIGGISINSNQRIFRQYSRNGYLDHSDDFGKSWDTTYFVLKDAYGTLDTIRSLSSIRLEFDKNGIYGMFYHRNLREYNPEVIYFTTDGGDNWENFNFDFSKLDSEIPEDEARIIKIKMIDTVTFVFRFYDTHPQFEFKKREIHYTSDRGQTWKKIKTPYNLYEQNEEIFCYDKETFFLSGDYLHHPEYYDTSPYIYKTTNQGETWEKVFHTNEYPTYFTTFLKLNDGTILTSNSYKILRSNDVGLTWKEDEIEKDSTHQLSGLYYDYKNDKGILSGTGSAYWELTSMSSVKKMELNHFFSLYPNPAEATSQITLDFHNELPREVEIYDLLGNLVLSRKTLQNILEIDISKLGTGTYIVKSNYGEQSLSRKFIKK